jgi:SPP1 gp7 family putative phage head morphogenesis protein
MGVTLGRSIVESTYRPDSGRRFSCDLNRPAAYWRPLTPVEQKIDFAAMEIADGDVLQRARMRLGLILAAQMTKLIELTRAPSMSATTASRIELPFEKDVQTEFFYLAKDGYLDGAQVFDRAKDRSARIAGRPVPPSRVYGISSLGMKRMRAKAAKRGTEFCAAIGRPIHAALDDVFSAEGVRQKPQAMLEGEIRSIYAKWIDVAPGGPVVHLAAPPLEIFGGESGLLSGGREPITGWLKIAAEGITRSNQPIPELKTNQTQAFLETERTRAINEGLTAAGLKDQNTVAFQFTAIRDGKTCGECLDRDGTVADKNDDFWIFNCPPLHPRCRCHRVPVFAWEPVKYSTDAMLREIDTSGLAPGFGTYDRRADEDLFPTSRAISKAIERAKPSPRSMPSAAASVANALKASERASAEYQRAQAELDIARLIQTADDLAYLRANGTYRPGSDAAKADAKATTARENMQREQDRYLRALRGDV